MQDNNMLEYIKEVLEQMPNEWVGLTTHRLDIYDESLAKTQFLDQFQNLYKTHNADTSALSELPTAYDYIRLGHPLSSILEWAIANLNNLNPENVISFSSKTMPILAVLRKNLLDHKKTRILHTGALPESFDADLLRSVYGYTFELKQVDGHLDISTYDGSTILISQHEELNKAALTLPTDSAVDFFIQVQQNLGSVLLVNGKQNQDYIGSIQHVRRRETIAMTPINSLIALKSLVGLPSLESHVNGAHKTSVLDSIKEITGTTAKPLVASSGLSIQYAIMMGLVHHAQEHHKGKAIKFIVPPNCYGGTNDQARRVAACMDHVDIVDLHVDGDNDMVRSIDAVLAKIANDDAVPYIIAEIPTNPRVEVPDLQKLKSVLSTARKTAKGEAAIDPVFILDQTFCPNYQFLGEGEILSTVRAISYASGSKFPSGGQCTAGYVVANNKAEGLMNKIALHLELCDNEATAHQFGILAKQLPSMNQRIKDAYNNTREFVTFIQETLPGAKINFVSEALAQQGFTPSVFSLDLPTKGATDEERETYKRALNLKLINMMITEIPHESKYCVSYGQLHGCYWTIPATSTQGTTKEGDKDYIARVSCSPDMDMELHKKVFLEFVSSI
ncbi:PLP-dependent transferase [Sediminicola sp. 1XM1-17]|uniref:PLP-dependent transferase n=1 Tax=Sediminicola sp. 1XM1-17 TaxID=3127702 RepID=UPI00307731F9